MQRRAAVLSLFVAGMLPAGAFAQSMAAQGYLQVYADGHPVTFEDVPADAWFTDAVRQVVGSGLASGYKDASGNLTGFFGPGDAVTYAQLAKMGLAAADKTVSAGGSSNATARGTWADGYIAAAEQLHLSVYGTSLNVNKPAKRGAVVQTLLELWGIPTVGGPNPYADLPSSHPYAKALLTATAMGIIQGDTVNGTHLVRPDDPVNRAEIAKLLLVMKSHPMGETPPPAADSSSSSSPVASSSSSHSSALTPPPPPPPASSSAPAPVTAGATYQVTANSNLRGDARSSAQVITVLYPGDIVTLIRTVDVWAEVTTSDGKHGYVAVSHLAKK